MSKKNQSLLYVLFLALLSVLLFFGCSPKVEFDFSTITSKQNLTVGADISFSTGISETAVSAIKNLTGISPDEPLFDKKAISESLKSSGLKEKAVLLNSDSSIDVKIYSADLSKIGNTDTPIFKTLYNKTTKEVSVSTVLNQEAFENLFSIFPEEFADYAELLMAPIFTGEKLSQEEYLELIGAAYGNSLQKELADSVCILKGSTPGKITNLIWNNKEITDFIGKNNFQISIPLSFLLAANDEISFSVSWK